MNNADKAAFPQHKLDNVTGKVSQQQSRGLTKRELFAMTAMQGICSDGAACAYHTWDDLSHDAVAIADALLNELEETND